MIARAVPYIGKQSTGSDEEDAKMVSKAIAELVEGLGHKTSLTEVCSCQIDEGLAADLKQYKVPPGEEESIASHALVGGKDHPEFKTCKLFSSLKIFHTNLKLQ